ncbi:hypothetical protein HK102_001796 [Quaeritorhiza haematococci]|nr:hypothetical protein HK102_001796 [Quaeritorhiza haematococci]
MDDQQKFKAFRTSANEADTATATTDSSSLTTQDYVYSTLFSSIAAFITRCTTHPLDTLKTRIQYSSASPASHETIPSQGALRSTLKTTLQTEGVRALYRGLPVALVFSVPGLGFYLASYDYFKAQLAGSRVLEGLGVGGVDSVVVHGLAGACAEGISGAFWTPMEVLKNKLQVAVTNNTTTFQLAKSIYRNEGLRGFFRGYWLSLGVFIPYTVVYFVTYEQLKLRAAEWVGSSTESFESQSLRPSSSSIPIQATNNQQQTQYETSMESPSPNSGVIPRMSPLSSILPPYNAPRPSESIQNDSSFPVDDEFIVEEAQKAQSQQLPFYAYLLCSATSGALAGAISNVMDVVKTRVQVAGGVENGSTGSNNSNALKTILHMWRREGGWRAFTKGMGARILWVTPSVTLSMSVYETLKDWRDRSQG